MPSFRTTRRVPFTPRQMFDLVADVERYPEFLPLCEALTVQRRERAGRTRHPDRRHDGGLQGDPRDLHEPRATSIPCGLRGCRRRRLRRDGAVQPAGEPLAACRAAPGGGCEVEFFIAYEFSSTMLQMLVGALFDRAFRRYTRAFEERAHAIYGAGASAATRAAS